MAQSVDAPKIAATTVRLEGKAWANFERKKRLAVLSKKRYTEAIIRYMNHHGMVTPDELIFDPLTGKQYETRAIEDRIEAYLQEQADKGRAPSTQSSVIWALKYFYETANRIPLAWSYLTGNIEKSDEDMTYKAYEKAHIRDMIRLATDPKLQPLTLFLCSTGVREAAVTQFKLKHLHRLSELLPEDDPEYAEYRSYEGYLVEVYPGTVDRYFTFTTPEAARAIDAYKRYREANGEILTPESPLFREKFRPNNAATPKPLCTNSIATIYQRLQVKVGLRKDSGRHLTQTERGSIRHEIHAVHGFRSFCDTALKNSEVDRDYRNFLMGHDTGLDKNYYDYRISPSVRTMLRQYTKATNLLTIDEAEQLKRNVIALRQKVDKVDMLSSQVESMMQELKNLQKAE